ncbi:MAG: cupin domain-containing protein [Nitrospirae bacterium]|nr:cupin domain-containing protein [Nitrospirota bacterium]
MNVKDVSKIAEFSPEKMKKVNLFETERVLCDVYGLEPGQAQKAHTHEGQDKIYMVLSGQVKVKVGSSEQTLSKDQIVIAPSGEDHGVTNPGPDRATLLVLMAPVQIHKEEKHEHHGHEHHGHGHQH